MGWGVVRLSGTTFTTKIKFESNWAHLCQRDRPMGADPTLWYHYALETSHGAGEVQSPNVLHNGDDVVALHWEREGRGKREERGNRKGGRGKGGGRMVGGAGVV